MDESPEQPVMSEKKTIELCPEKIRRGERCILPRGHAGEHLYEAPGIIRLLAR